MLHTTHLFWRERQCGWTGGRRFYFASILYRWMWMRWSKRFLNAKSSPKSQWRCSVAESRHCSSSSPTSNPSRHQLQSAVMFMVNFGTSWSCWGGEDRCPGSDTCSWGTTWTGGTTQSRQSCFCFFTSWSTLRWSCYYGATTSPETSPTYTASMIKSHANMATTTFGTTSMTPSTTSLSRPSSKDRSFACMEDYHPNAPPSTLSGRSKET